MDARTLAVMGLASIALGFLMSVFFEGDPGVGNVVNVSWFHGLCFLVGLVFLGAAWYVHSRR